MTIRLLPVVWLLLAALAPSASVAATDCMQTAQTQADVTQCAGQEYKAADARLNQQYQTLVSRLADRPEQKTRLVTAQRRWLAFRDGMPNVVSPRRQSPAAAPNRWCVYSAWPG